MKAVSQFVVHVFDLLEAEGGALRRAVRDEAGRASRSAANLFLGLAALVVAVPLAVVGVGLIAAGLMWWLESEVGRPLAAALTGVAVIVAAAICVAWFRAVVARVQP